MEWRLQKSFTHDINSKATKHGNTTVASPVNSYSYYNKLKEKECDKMGAFKSAIITQKGQELLATVVAGTTKLEFY